MPATVCQAKPKRRSSSKSRSTGSKTRRSSKSRSTTKPKTKRRRSKACVPRVRLNNCCRSFDTDICVSSSPGKYSDNENDGDFGNLASVFSEGGRQVRFVESSDGEEVGEPSEFIGEPSSQEVGEFTGGPGGQEAAEFIGGEFTGEATGQEKDEFTYQAASGGQDNELAHILRHYRKLTRDHKMTMVVNLLIGLLEVDSLKQSNGFITVGAMKPDCDPAQMQQDDKCGASFLNLDNDRRLPARLTEAADRQMQQRESTVFAFVVTDGDGQRLSLANTFEEHMRTNSFYSPHVHAVIVSSSEGDKGVTYLSWHEGANVLTSEWNPATNSHEELVSHHLQSLQADESVTRKGAKAGGHKYYDKLAADGQLGLMFNVVSGIRDEAGRRPLFGIISVDDIDTGSCYLLSSVPEANKSMDASKCGMSLYGWLEPDVVLDNLVAAKTDQPDKTIVAFVVSEEDYVERYRELLKAEDDFDHTHNLHVFVLTTSTQRSTLVSRHVTSSTTWVASREIHFDSRIDYTKWDLDTWKTNIAYLYPSFKDDVLYDDGSDGGDDGEYKEAEEPASNFCPLAAQGIARSSFWAQE